jgi:rhodanese-related sulfurtransferase
MKLIATAIIVVCLCSTNFYAFAQTKQAVAKPQVELISAEELKAKMARNEPVTIIDVRATESYAESDTRIKGAIHVKLRRLKSRLALPPLNKVPRDREIVTYCACPSEESSLAAAQVLLDAGFKRVRALKGGWEEWRKINGQVELRPKAL